MRRTYVMGQMAHVITTGSGAPPDIDLKDALLRAAAEVRVEISPPPAPAAGRDSWTAAWFPPPPCGDGCCGYGPAPCGSGVDWD